MSQTSQTSVAFSYADMLKSKQNSQNNKKSVIITSARQTMSRNSSNLNLTQINTDNQNLLHNVWVLWYHEMNSSDWSRESYLKVAEFKTVEEFWTVYNHLPTLVVNGMWFLMRKEWNNELIYPLWEDPSVINGGAWLFKVHKSQADNSWLNLSELLIGETICNDSEQKIMGLSISPKRHYVTIRVWNNDKTQTDTSIFNENIPNINFNEAIYKVHQE